MKVDERRRKQMKGDACGWMWMNGDERGHNLTKVYKSSRKVPQILFSFLQFFLTALGFFFFPQFCSCSNLFFLFLFLQILQCNVLIDEHNPARQPKNLMFYPVARDLTVFISRPPPSSIPNKSDRVGREEGQACFQMRQLPLATQKRLDVMFVS